ncbi:MAG: hypothetical protein H2172_03965 [Opitutus sp.]|nr:hypothetical protein [Opitutus sp.]MCS6246393.1 hypothetical protein [Opitutus sp.]MCS6273251.1 hypothetical protein [Opitutus sp.]MCS6277973.1 hypothetical protein [Opitutus sp.]MCS6298920.1 hypothetical protein [Opitutus sp.]
MPLFAAKQATAGTSTVSTSISAGVTQLSIHCRTANARFAVGYGAQTASATTGHFIAAGERLKIDIPLPTAAGTARNIAFIRDSAAVADAAIEITEIA